MITEKTTLSLLILFTISFYFSLSLYLPNTPAPFSLSPHSLCVQNIAHYCTTTDNNNNNPTDHRRKSSSMYEVFNWGYSNDEPPKRFSLSIAGSEINIDGPVPVKHNAHKLTSTSTTTPPTTTTTAHRQTTSSHNNNNNNSYRKGEGSFFSVSSISLLFLFFVCLLYLIINYCFFFRCPYSV